MGASNALNPLSTMKLLVPAVLARLCYMLLPFV